MMGPARTAAAFRGDGLLDRSSGRAYCGRMQPWRMWMAGVVLGAAIGAAAQAEPMPVGAVSGQGAPPAAAPSVEECKAKCGVLVDECMRNLGTSLGDMRQHCENAAVRRCRGVGLGVCERVAEGPVPDAPPPAARP